MSSAQAKRRTKGARLKKILTKPMHGTARNRYGAAHQTVSIELSADAFPPYVMALTWWLGAAS